MGELAQLRHLFELSNVMTSARAQGEQKIDLYGIEVHQLCLPHDATN